MLPACTYQSDKVSSKIDKPNLSESQKTKSEKVTIPRVSPSAYVEQTIGLSTISIRYSRPNVISPDGVDRTGKIWGRLVPYDFNSRTIASKGKPIPWRAGANENTVITLSHDAMIEGKPIKAGKYGLHMAIHPNSDATIIFSNDADAWGSFSYNPQKDALRVEGETKEIQNNKALLYTIREIDKTSGKVMLDWEKKRIEFEIVFDTHGVVMADFRKKLTDTSGLTWSDYDRAAKYCVNNSVNLKEGLSWSEKSIKLKESYQTLSTEVEILDALGRSTEANKIKSKALNIPSTTPDDFYSYGTVLIRQEKLDSANKIYLRLRKQWPDHWLGDHGLARWNSAQGNYIQAINMERKALSKTPEVNKGFIEWAITKLEQGNDFNY